MRNTCNIIPLDVLVKMGGFNPLCNGDAHIFSSPSVPFSHYQPQGLQKFSIRGMEDIEFFKRLFFHSSTANTTELRELYKAMENVIFYTDKSWNKLDELEKIKKISNEMAGLSLIIAGIADIKQTK